MQRNPPEAVYRPRCLYAHALCAAAGWTPPPGYWRVAAVVAIVDTAADNRDIVADNTPDTAAAVGDIAVEVGAGSVAVAVGAGPVAAAAVVVDNSPAGKPGADNNIPAPTRQRPSR